MRFLRTESREGIFLAEGSSTAGGAMLAFFPALVVTLGWLLLLRYGTLDDLLLHKPVKKWIK